MVGEGGLIDGVDISGLDDVFQGEVTKKAEFFVVVRRQRPIAPTQQDIGLDP